MKREKCQLLVVDIQEKFIPTMFEIDRVIDKSCQLIEAAAILSIPTTITEKYPKGLGSTLGSILTAAGDIPVFPKQHFSCTKDSAITERFDSLQRNQVVICGIETHVCVLQTAMGLKGNGFDVFVVADACTSRDPKNADFAYTRMQNAGIWVVSTEMVLFEWLEVAGGAEFKQLSQLIK